MKFYNTKSIVISVVTGMFLLGCGGGGDAPVAGASSSTAFLSDSRLEGITYTCGSDTGLTTAEGAFTYTNGACAAVEFSIGGVSLGSIDIADINPDGIIYPADLLGLDRNNTSDAALINLLQVLQSLDSDGNPNNGILIDSNTTTLLENETDLNSSVGTAGRTLVDADDAVAHYEDTLRNDLNITVDTVPPSAAIITMTPSETYVDMTSITINGEVGARIWINGIDSTLSIDTNNSATFDVNTSNNTDVNNTSSIVLVDDANKSSDTTESSIFRASQATLDVREVSAIKTGLEASTTPRAFTYTQMWASGADYNISFTPVPVVTTETQEYNATATITKGSASDTLTIPETVVFSQDLRDAAEVAAIATEITSNKRTFTYTQQWATGADYNVTFSEEMRASTTETQTYDLNATVRKGNTQETIMLTEIIPFSQNLRDLAEIAAIKNGLTARNFMYTQQWATGSNYTLLFSEVLRSATTEAQTYPVTVTITKGTFTDTKTFTESVPYSQLLRDMAEVAYIKNNLTSRAFSYTQQWATGLDYSLNFSELLKDATTETQTYPVTVTITKGAASDSVAYSEVVPFSQDLRDSVEVLAIKTNLEAMADIRTAFSYTLQWATGSNYTVTFSEAKRIPTAIDQSYSVTVTITKGTQTETIVYTELVPTTNVNIVLGDGTTTLINDEYKDAFVVTNGGVFQRVGNESEFIGAAVSLDTTLLNGTIASSTDLLNFLVTNSSLSGLNSIYSRNSNDGSLTARYEVVAQGQNLYTLLENLLASLNYTIDNVDFSAYANITNVFVDIYVEYDAVNNSYIILSLTDKSIDFDSDIVKIINRDSVVQVNEIIVNEQETFSFTNTQPKGDFIFVIDDSGSMSSEQASVIDAIEKYFSKEVTTYNLDWKATVIGTEDGRNYSNFVLNPTENNITALSSKLDALTTSGGDEVGMKRVYGFLTDGSITERNNSSTTIIYASDEPEHSMLSEIGLTDSNLKNSYFVKNGIRYYAMLQEKYRNTNELSFNMAKATGGQTVDLYDYVNGYKSVVKLAVKYAIAKNSSIKLAYPALASSITVHVKGVKTTAWEYDPIEYAIVFHATSRPAEGDNIIVTYSHLDYAAIVADLKTDFDALNDNEKRAYTNNDIDITYDPESPNIPLLDSDQSYEVNVKFSKLGYETNTTYTETVLKSDYYTTKSTEWDGTNNFVSQNTTAKKTTTLEFNILRDTTLTYTLNYKNKDRLNIYVNNSNVIYIYNKDANASIDVSAGDVVRFEHKKYYASSISDANATVRAYNQEDFETVVANSKVTFDAINNNDKRDYNDVLVDVVYSPATKNEVTDTDQVYDVAVTLSKYSYTQNTTYQETVYSVANTLTVSSDVNWTQSGTSFTSVNETAKSTSTLEITMQRDTRIEFSLIDRNYDTLKVYKNATLVQTLSNTSTAHVDVLNGDVMKFEHYKRYDSSSASYNAKISIK